MRKISRWGNEIQRGPVVGPESASDKVRSTPESEWPQSPQPLYLASVQTQPLENCVLLLKPAKWQKLCPKRLLWRVWRRLLRVPWTARSNRSVLKEINLNVYWEDWCWSWSSNISATWWEKLIHLKRPWCWKDWGQERRGQQDEMVGWHHQLNGHEFEKTLGDGEEQGSLACCSPWGCKELDMMSDWTTTIPWRVVSKHQGLWMKSMKNGKCIGGCRSTWARYKASSERGECQVCVLTDTGAQEDSWGAARSGVAHNWF